MTTDVSLNVVSLSIHLVTGSVLTHVNISKYLFYQFLDLVTYSLVFRPLSFITLNWVASNKNGERSVFIFKNSPPTRNVTETFVVKNFTDAIYLLYYN